MWKVCKYIQFHILLVTAMLFSASIMADPDDRYPFGHLNSDPTPVTFNVGGIRYRFPANYMLDVSESSDKELTIASLTAVFPSMQPYSPETEHCYKTPPLYRSADCQILKFFIQPPGALNMSDPVSFENSRKLFHSQTPIKADYGYEKYETGPENARGDTYRKVINAQKNILASCFSDKTKEMTAVCFTSFSTEAGGIIHVMFDSNELDKLEKMIEAIGKFVDEHTLPHEVIP